MVVMSPSRAEGFSAAMFCMFPDSKSEWKKWATGQSFIRKEITSYRIGTLNRLYHTGKNFSWKKKWTHIFAYDLLQSTFK